MNNNSYRIATEIMLKMDEAIERKDTAKIWINNETQHKK